MSDTALEVKNLYKKYQDYVAVDSISFKIPTGKIIGLLGPNGAGKSTTIQMLTGITLADSGSISYFGKDFYKDRVACLMRINYTSAYNNLQGKITVRENLKVFSMLYGLNDSAKKIDELLEFFEITHLQHVKFWDLSAGQKTRVNVAKSLLNDPDLILMDEPTASLDPDIADKMLTFIEEMNKKNKLTILYTSHNMDEVAKLCDEVIFLDHGKIVAQDTPLGLTKRVTDATLILTFASEKVIMEQYLNKRTLQFTFVTKTIVKIKTEEKNIPKILFGMTDEDIWVTDITVEKPSLEDVFLQIARG